ncbi:hypothetical protein M513_13122 [Trichuris suis]|uniref:Major facilitator superfamily (MFS) profile domain-containing protein n=1 Tax=Trichuris suis TaxID=68888 RepID=A0A085LM09_9BILA|nr:hypothetical protein M513_13122 [Trichuris suis]
MPLIAHSTHCVFRRHRLNLHSSCPRSFRFCVLTELQEYYGIGDWEAGLLQTVFITFYMVFAPIFGYLGDRYSRKVIMICGVLVWSGAVLLSTFVPAHRFVAFLFLRGVVGIGEASYATVSVTILGDLFTKSRRSQMLMVFFFAVPLGRYGVSSSVHVLIAFVLLSSGLGFIVGSMVTKVAAGQWQWGVRVTPPLGLLCIGLILLAMEEPKRGSAEQSNIAEITTFVDDIHYLVHVRSYLWTTLGFTCVAFTVGSLSWWTPNFIIYSQRSIGVVPDNAHINTVFGAITALSGFVGVAVGCGWSQLWRRSNPRADPLVCAIGLFIAVPFLFAAICIPHLCLTAVWPLIFVTITALCLNWSILSDILLSVIVPHRRSTANAFQMLTSHLLGDAVSPYIIGQFSDYLRGEDQSEKAHYESLQYALFVTPFAAILGAFFFCCCAWCIERDRAKMVAESLATLVANKSVATTNESAQIIADEPMPNIVEDQLMTASLESQGSSCSVTDVEEEVNIPDKKLS